MIDLPRLRIDLYNEAIRYLLEGHNTSRELPSINEAQTIECLGSIAIKMLEDGQTLLHRDDVARLVKQSIRATEEHQVEEFLHRIRERSGLFVQFENEYGFSHQTFHEYFAARFLIRNINNRRIRRHCIENLILKGCSTNSSWREVFLLAVAYQSGKNRNIANEILEGLYERILTIEDKDRAAIIELAADCLNEVRPLSIKNTLKDKILKLNEQTHKKA